MILNSLDRFRDVGLLLVRVGLGVSFLFHGWPKIISGPERWEGLAASSGITVFPAFFGFMGAFSEFFGGILLIVGLLFRPATALLAITMAVAFLSHLQAGDGFGTFSHAMELGIVFLGLFLIGPGRYSIDYRLREHE